MLPREIHRDAAFLPNRIHAAQECDATTADSSNTACAKKILLKIHSYLE